jgi:hypothetical protein
MDTFKDDFRRRNDGSIDYDFYRASAAEFRRAERKRLILAAIRGAIGGARKVAKRFAHLSWSGTLGSAQR